MHFNMHKMLKEMTGTRRTQAPGAFKDTAANIWIPKTSSPDGMNMWSSYLKMTVLKCLKYMCKSQ